MSETGYSPMQIKNVNFHTPNRLEIHDSGYNWNFFCRVALSTTSTLIIFTIIFVLLASSFFCVFFVIPFLFLFIKFMSILAK